VLFSGSGRRSFWPGGKVNAETILFLRTGLLCLDLSEAKIDFEKTSKTFSNPVDTGTDRA
jgi:hypothetical protein